MSKTPEQILQEAEEEIKAKLSIAETAINMAEKIAEDNGLVFSWDGPTYGMGGTYYPAGYQDEYRDRPSTEDELGWQASSHSC